MPARKPRNLVLDQNKLTAIAAWNEVIPKLSQKQKAELLRFREKYGEEAMVRRAQAMLADRIPLSWGVVGRLKLSLARLAGLRQIWSYKRKKLHTLNRIARRERMVRELGKRAEPLVKSMTTLAYHNLVLERWLSPAELTQWEKKSASQQEINHLKELIRNRSGRSSKDWAREVSNSVVADLAEVWAGSLREAQDRTQNQAEQEEIDQGLQTQELNILTKIYLKGIKQNG